MEEQGPTVTIITFPNVSPAEMFPPPSVCSHCSTASTTVQNLTTLAEGASTSTTSPPAVRFQKVRCSSLRCASSRSTSVRLVSPGDGRTQTVLQIDPPTEVPSTSPDDVAQDSKKRRKNGQPRAPSPRPVYTKLQWSLIFLSWVVAFCGLILFLSSLGFMFKGYHRLLVSSLGSVAITLISLVSVMSGSYFFFRIYNYLK